MFKNPLYFDANLSILVNTFEEFAIRAVKTLTDEIKILKLDDKTPDGIKFYHIFIYKPNIGPITSENIQKQLFINTVSTNIV